MVKSMYEATAEFITERINYHGAYEPEALQDVATNLCDSVKQLQATLTEEQLLMFQDIENHYADVDGTQMRFYFEAGFSDAVRFFVDWGKWEN